MKAVLAGFAAVVVIGIGAYVVLGEMGFDSQSVYASDNVRLD